MISYDPYDYAIHADPYPVYAALRDHAPLYHNPDGGFWALSRHADVVAGFRDAGRLSSADGVSIDPAASGRHASRAMSFLAMDDPRHGRMRALVSAGFTPRRVADLAPAIDGLTASYLEPALDGSEFDFMADFASRLPMDVISELLGVPAADRDQVRTMADLLVHRDEGVSDIPRAGLEAALELAGYFDGLINDRARAPRQDLLSALLEVELDGERLTREELISFLFLMTVAGNETTAKLLGNAWYWAWRHADVGAAVRADASRVPDWVEETLRYDTSTQMLARTATVDIEIHDGVIPAGGRVLLLVASANRDPRVFPDPDTYLLDRDRRELASFGVGRHYCLGASLARLEATAALRALASSVDGWEIDESRMQRVHSVNVRGFSSLPTKVGVR